MDLDSLQLKIARSENLPVLPQIVNEVLRLADDPNTSAKAIEQIIERDPAITAKILRVANSAYYGLNQVPSIGRAISILGFNSIRSLIVGVAYQQVLAGPALSTSFDKLSFWQHSLAVATGARILGKIRLPIKAEELYSAAMMHDVGILVLDRFCPEELDIAVKHSLDEGMPLHQSEEAVLGFDHGHVGCLLAEKWGLSAMMKNTIKYINNPSEDEQHGQTTSFIAVADVLADQCGFANNAPTAGREVDPKALEIVGIPEEQLEVIRNVMVQEITRAQEAFSIQAAA